jgi:gliding motility-associated-like protein
MMKLLRNPDHPNIIRQLLLMVVMLVGISAHAQTVDVGPPDTSVCNGQAVTLTAITTGVGTNPTFTNLNFNTDDLHGGVVDIGFDFDFFGNTYNQCVVSTNGYITFNLGTANTGSPWSIGAASPTPGVPDNAIMFPWQDINPGSGSGGTNSADCGDGTFIVDFIDIAMFSCTDLDFTMQVVLYENTNIIETYISEKPLCTTWNGGAAIHGLENANGTQAVVVPGRNFPTQWTTTNDAVRFTPNGSGGYTVDQNIPFNPIPVGQENIVWTDGNGTVLGNTNSITVSPTQATWYYCTFQSACSAITVKDSILVTLGNVNITTSKQNVSCFEFSDGTISVDPVGSNFPVTIELTDDAGQVVDVMTNANGVVTFGGLVAGDYTATVIDAVGCETGLDVTLTQPTLLEVTAGHRNILCTGDNNGKAYATANGGTPPYDLAWSDQFQQTTDTILYLGPGPYEVTVTDSKGCVVDTTVIVVQPLPLNIQFTVGADTCGRHDGAILTQTQGGTKPYVYLWNTIPDSAFYAVDAIGNFNTITHLATGDYSVLVVDSNDCEIQGAVNVPLIIAPQAAFSSRSMPEELTNPVVEFFNESTASLTYQWHFGDGDVSNVEHPEHAYTEPGAYLVMLIAYNEPRYGCSDTTFRYMQVEPLFTFYVPNSFTPDGDGLNDEFKPVGENFEYESYNLQIFDRWGGLIWQTDNPLKGWNGQNQSSLEPVKNGLYIYIFTMKKFNTFEPKVIKGSVHLYRTRDL